MHKRHIFAILYGLVLTAFTVYVLLDTFVITRVYTEVSTLTASSLTSGAEVGTESHTAESTDAENVENEDPGAGISEKISGSAEVSEEVSAEAEGSSAASQSISTQTSYQDENITITLKEYTVSDTTVYVADVQVASADLLKTALAQNAYGRNVTQKTSEMAENAGAILAINGDYYGSQQTGYVLRNGVLYRAAAEKGQEDLVIYEDGSFSIINESEVTAESLLEGGAVQILSFGPALVVDGEIAVSAGEEVGKAMASNPRTAIGIIDEGHYVFVVSDGRTNESEGLSLSELAAFMQRLGVETAYNLDGGGSSTMYFNGEVVNNPTTSGNSIKERSVSDIVYIGY